MKCGIAPCRFEGRLLVVSSGAGNRESSCASLPHQRLTQDNDPEYRLQINLRLKSLAEQSEGPSRLLKKPSEAMARVAPFWLRRGAQT